MSATDTSSISAVEQANEMYWNSDRTVDEILQELGIGRSTLYSAVRPVEAGASCSTCGDNLVYTNRTNRESHTGTCPSCATEIRLDSPMSETEAEARSGGDSRAAMDEQAGWARWRGGLAGVSRQRVAMVGGAAALGVVIGAAATRALREMR